LRPRKRPHGLPGQPLRDVGEHSHRLPNNGGRAPPSSRGARTGRSPTSRQPAEGSTPAPRPSPAPPTSATGRSRSARSRPSSATRPRPTCRPRPPGSGRPSTRVATARASPTRSARAASHRPPRGR
jgi:hypothetical protein